MEQIPANTLKTLVTAIAVLFITAGCTSTNSQFTKDGVATCKYVLKHGSDGTLINVEFKGAQATITALEDKGDWRQRVGASSNFKNVVMSDFTTMKRCDLHFPAWTIMWVFNEDGTCTVWENRRNNPKENGKAIRVEGRTLQRPLLIRNYLVKHGIDGTLINIEFQGSKATIVAASDNYKWKESFGKMSDLKVIAMANVSEMRVLDLSLFNWNTRWLANDD